MRNLLPAVAIGGPPHAGKSVLAYALQQALRERGIDHYLLRACPDGDGNWFYEGEPEMVSELRIPRKGTWPPTFIQRVSQDLQHRCLPLLVDMGGLPQVAGADLFRLCTHAILLLREDRPEATALWQQMTEEYNLLLLARLFSQREGPSEITARLPLLEGTITGLEYHTVPVAGYGPMFDALVECIANLFRSYNLHDQKSRYFEHAPTELVLDLDSALDTFTTSSTRWEPAWLAPYLATLPRNTPLSVYGVGPNWLYAALAAHSDQQPFYQFDPRLPFGWVQPARVSIGEERSPELHVELHVKQDMSVLHLMFPQERLAYFQPDPLTFPAASPEKGLFIDGRLPYWLLTALTRLYQAASVPWIAPFHASIHKAVVVYSRIPTLPLGALIDRPTI